MVQWLDTYNKAFLEQEELMKYVGKGLNLFGPKPDGSAEALVEVNIQKLMSVKGTTRNMRESESFKDGPH